MPAGEIWATDAKNTSTFSPPNFESLRVGFHLRLKLGIFHSIRDPVDPSVSNFTCKTDKHVALLVQSKGEETRCFWGRVRGYIPRIPLDPPQGSHEGPVSSEGIITQLPAVGHNTCSRR